MVHHCALRDILMQVVLTLAKWTRYKRLVQRSVSCSTVKSTAALHLGWCDCLFTLDENTRKHSSHVKSFKMTRIRTYHLYSLDRFSNDCLAVDWSAFLKVLEYTTSETSMRRICASAPSDHQGASWPVGDTVAQCLGNPRNLSLLSVLNLKIYTLRLLWSL